MSGQDLTLLNALTRKMSWHEDRQRVLATNIANANTPGYKPQDLTALKFKDLLSTSASTIPLGNGGAAPVVSALQLASPNADGSAESRTSVNGDNSKEQNEKKPYEVKPDGNAVILEEQLVKMNQNFADHRLASNLYQKNINMLEEAVK
jgi:flagellar basal-body rod protein FlgB